MITITLTCTRCRKDFPASVDSYRQMELAALPKRCPACLDEIQERPDVVLDCTTLAEYVCRVHHSAARLLAGADMFQPRPTDVPSHRRVVKGSDYGVCWNGRIDLYTHVWPVSAGDVVTLSHNQVTRRVWFVERQQIIARMAVFNGGPPPRVVTISRRVERNYTPQEGESAVRERTEVNEYVVLSRSLESTAHALQRDALPLMCWMVSPGHGAGGGLKHAGRGRSGQSDARHRHG